MPRQKEEPYKYEYREYPRLLYKADGSTLAVESDKDKAAALKAGWTLEPPPA
jgi:hypothetical protein